MAERYFCLFFDKSVKSCRDLYSLAQKNKKDILCGGDAEVHT